MKVLCILSLRLLLLLSLTEPPLAGEDTSEIMDAFLLSSILGRLMPQEWNPLWEKQAGDIIHLI